MASDFVLLEPDPQQVWWYKPSDKSEAERGKDPGTREPESPFLKDVYVTMASYQLSRKIPKIDELHCEVVRRSWLREDPEDVEVVEWTVADERIVSVEMISRLQGLVTRMWPGCRVRFNGDTREDTIVISSDTVTIGGKDVSRNIDRALGEWKEDLFRRREKTRAPQRQQFVHVKKVLKNEFARNRAPSCTVLAAFKGYRGDASMASLWLLYRGDYSGYEISGHPTCGVDYEVDDNARVGIRYEYYKDAPYSIAQWIFPVQDCITLTIRHRTADEHWEFRIEESELINTVPATPAN
ncbi:MAG: hypothetical protein RIC55_19615 [Pirellulaceae bacterium]